MGLFDKLKKAATFLTGGGAKVKLDIAEGVLGSPFTANIEVQISDDSDLTVKSVYLNVRCTETTKKEAELAEDAEVTSEEAPEPEEDVNYLYNETITVAEGDVFKAGQTYTFTPEISLPEDSEATLSEEGREITWTFQAGLDVSGNDPDSGWIEAEITHP